MRLAHSFHRLACFTLPFAFAAAGSESFAALLNWNNPAGGSASTPGNWTPAQVPAAPDILQFDLNGVFTTTFNATTPFSSQMRLRDGTITLSFSSPHVNSAALWLADAVNDTVDARITSGSLTCNGFVSIGQAIPAKATLEVRGGTTILDLAGASSDLHVGTFGNGTLKVTQGGSVQVADDMIVGGNPSAAGIVTVTGRSISPLVPSNLVTTTSSSDIIVGEDGYGELHIETYATVFCSGDLSIAPVEHAFFDGNGIVTVGEVTTTASSSLTVDADLIVGGLAGVGGNATLHVLQNGLVQVNGTTFVGKDAASNPDAILRVDGGSLLKFPVLRTRNLEIGANAILDFPSGQIVVDGGALDPSDEPLTINGAGGGIFHGPRLVFTNGATTTLADPGSPNLPLTIGTTGFGEVRVDSSASLTLEGDLALGVNTGGTGLVKVSHGAILALETLDAGNAGAAQIVVDTGSTLTCGDLELGTDFNGTGTMTVRDAGSVATAAIPVRIGAGIATAEPVNILIVSNDGTFLATSPTGASRVEGSGGLSISSGGDFIAASDLDVIGEVNLDGGSVAVDELFVHVANGELNGRGTVAGKVFNSGTVAPGLSAGKLTIQGNYTQTSTGILAIELGNHASSQWDTLAVPSGSATLAGTLAITMLPTYSAGSGSTFIILTCASRTGTFSSVTLNGGPLAGFTIDYNATNVSLKSTGATDAPTALVSPLVLELLGTRGPSGSALLLNLPASAQVRLSLFDVAGREIAVLREGAMEPGRHRFDVGGGSLPRLASGVYFGRALVSASTGELEVRSARVPIVR